ncbi:MAG: efflux RND transporter periplasmic adaptor subunit, partial [Gemmataceae bacterium]|nr:efflux RND transporter periplasmic adaptor subunit [Gemmataceae bacterium]
GPRPASSASNAPAGEGPAPAAPGEILLRLKGNLIPSLQIAVSPRDVSGELTGITFQEGKLVKEGDILATILDAQFVNKVESDKAAVAQAEAQHARARAAIKKADASAASAAASYKRAEADIKNWDAQIVLAKAEMRRAKLSMSGSAAAQTDVDKAQATLDANEAQRAAAVEAKNAAKAQEEAAVADVATAHESVRAAEADVLAAKARHRESERLLKNCTIVAPVAGTILTKKADKGSLVNPLAFSSTNGGSSGSLCEIADLSKLEVEMDVPEREITKAKPGLDCQIVADADPGRAYRGYVDRVMPIADDSKNVVKVRVRVVLPKGEVPGSFLKPKMSVVVVATNRPFAADPAKDQPWE